MGRQTVAKIEKQAAYEESFARAFAQHNKSLKEQEVKKEPALVTHLTSYLDKAIRNPEDFKSRLKSSDRDKLLLELVRFVFNKYPVNAMLSRVWRTQRNNVRQAHEATYRNWYVCVATGGSFYKEYAKEFFTKKEAHIFLNCTHDISVEAARVYAVAKAEGANEGQALRLARSKLNDKAFNDFWRGVIRFFVGHEPKNVDQVNDLVDYINAKRNENNAFTLFGSGHTIGSLLIKTEEWHRALQRAKELGNYTWEGHAINDSSFVRKDIYGNEVTWKLRQIKNSKELAAEGTRMRHCVLSYKTNCIQGTCSIWQMIYVDHIGVESNKLTIEVRNDGSIVQARGLANRAPRSEESHILDMWASQEGLKRYLSGYW